MEIDKAKRQFEELNVPAELKKIKAELQGVKKQLQLTKDDRSIKPYFFKYIGDNETKKNRRKAQKAHRRELDKATVE